MSTIYQGTPREIVERMAHEFSDVFAKASIPCSGIRLIALVHMVACVLQEAKDKPDAENKMPSFKAVLSVLTHSYTGSEWAEEELKEFGREFTGIIKSLGGEVLNKADAKSPAWVSGESGRVH